MKHLFLALAFSAFACGCSTVVHPTEDFTLSATASIRDGSVLKGTLLTDTISGAALFDDSLKLSAVDVRSIAFTGTNGESKVTLANGDSLTLTISTPAFDFESSLGTLSLERGSLKHLAICPHRIVRPNGKSDGEYCIIDIREGVDAAAFPVWYADTLPEGEEFKTTSIVLRKIPAGTFQMCNRAPVTISKSYFIGVYEVTRRQFQLLSKSKEWEQRWWTSGEHPDCPANFITFNMIRGAGLGSQWPATDAVDTDSILGVLREKTGLKFDLPTEAQWEYACRAGTTSAYNNGGSSEADLRQLGRYRGTGKGLAAVGSYQPNSWGLYDMHGNVFEWCLDWGPWPIREATDPVGEPSGTSRCLRGGSHDYLANECTSDFRYYLYGYPTNESAFFGFRLACPVK